VCDGSLIYLAFKYHLHVPYYSAVSGLFCPFGTLSYERHEFRCRFIQYKMCVQILFTVLSQTFIIMKKI